MLIECRVEVIETGTVAAQEREREGESKGGTASTNSGQQPRPNVVAWSWLEIVEQKTKVGRHRKWEAADLANFAHTLWIVCVADLYQSKSGTERKCLSATFGRVVAVRNGFIRFDATGFRLSLFIHHSHASNFDISHTILYAYALYGLCSMHIADGMCRCDRNILTSSFSSHPLALFRINVSFYRGFQSRIDKRWLLDMIVHSNYYSFGLLFRWL